MHNYEWFKNEAYKVHGDDYIYEPESYIRTKVKMWMTHKKCGHRFQQTPHNHLQGQGCPLCGKEYAKTCKKKKYEQFLKTAEERFGNRYSFPNVKEEYENSHSKITIKCNWCDKTFVKIACDFVSSKTGGCWCKETEPQQTITYDKLSKLVLGFDIEYFSDRKIINKDKIKITCKKCGYSYNAKVSSLVTGKYTCHACNGRENGKNRIIPVDIIKKRMDSDFPTIIVDYSNYSGTMKPLQCKCDICGYEFKRSVNAFFYGNKYNISPCPKCTSEAIKRRKTKTTPQFALQVDNLYGKGRYTLLSNYIASDKKIDVKCNECGRTFSIEANSFLQGHGCPYHNCNSSTKEKEIVEFIKSIYNCEIYNNDRKLLDGKEIDIFIPSMKMAFEFDGVFWHNENNKPNDYHLWKTLECEKHGVRLIHIFEDEWIYKKDIWKSMISNLLGVTKNKIYARKCIVKEVETKECTDFLIKNHIQGWCPSQIKLGLYYNNELVSIMTFGKSRHFIGNGKMEYELLRFCNKLNTNVVGGASKLFKHFVNTYNPNSVLSYCDRRWSKGNLYNNLGFTFSHFSKPNYYYVIGNVRKNRFNYRKSILVKKYGCHQDMSESEFCKRQKWYRIYDCGTAVYEWFKKD